MYSPKTIYTRIALEVIKDSFKSNSVNSVNLDNIPDELFEIRRGCFVSLHLRNGDLRGCIGTIEPVEENLYKEIIRNAIASSSRDSRFSPVEETELEDIELSVDVLSEQELINSIDELDPDIYGLIISDGKYSRGVLLPGLEGIGSVEQQISIVKKKAGLENKANESLEFYRFTSKRYY
ncbi:MAG: AmmeMemoRadiSam system protein A [Bacteroidetes bacterium]|nr:MAG: AmmeMemoRadiSam system protein A [Bacteroidota bacterium]